MTELDQKVQEAERVEGLARYYARHEARQAVRRYRNRSLAGFLVLLLGIGFAVHSNGVTAHRADEASKEAASVGALRDASVSECQRVNILRAQSNISNDVSFEILSSAAQREAALTKATHGSEQAIHRASALSFVTNAGRLKVTQLTNCVLATHDAASYQFPFAGPIGNPRTGHHAPGIEKILRASDALVSQHTQGSGTG